MGSGPDLAGGSSGFYEGLVGKRSDNMGYPEVFECGR